VVFIARLNRPEGSKVWLRVYLKPARARRIQADAEAA
jgi:hypothetical protein